MKLWQAPARALPVTVRPLGGETVLSYARRLAEANDLPATAIMRALGQLSQGSGYHLLDHDAWLSEQALDRLEAYSGIPRPRLTRALPALRHRPPHIPGQHAGAGPFLHVYRPWPHARPACRLCTLRAGGTPGQEALVRLAASPQICRRHKRWLGGAGETAQYDLSTVGEVFTAARCRTRLLSASTDRNWAGRIFSTAWQVTGWWAGTAPDRFPVLSRRWRTRAGALGIPPATHVPAVVTFPEAVTLAEILTDLNWRRHVAMVSLFDLDIFYRHVAQRMGEESYPSLLRNDPLRRWADGHRSRFASIRDKTWAKAGLPPQPFPEIRHFK